MANNRFSHRGYRLHAVCFAVAVVLPPVASEWDCPAGSIAGSHGVAACCPAACGHCSGRGCEEREGGRQACCALDIQTAGRSCNGTAPPCVPLARAEPGERTQHAVRFVSWNQCGSQAANLGTEHATAYECAAAAWDNAACGSAIMFSPEMNAHWGCRCCRGAVATPPAPPPEIFRSQYSRLRSIVQVAVCRGSEKPCQSAARTHRWVS